MSNYDDIINLPHHVSSTRKPMTLYNRASQFAPFSALTGYDDEIEETARLTDRKVELDDDSKKIINNKINFIAVNIKAKPFVNVLYFIQDKKKSGGKYIIYSGNIRVIDIVNECIIFTDKTKLFFENIYDITGKFFLEMKKI